MKATSRPFPVKWNRLPLQPTCKSQWHPIAQQNRNATSLARQPKSTLPRTTRLDTIAHTYIRRYASSSSPTPSMDQHEETVSQISATVRKFHDANQKFRIFHGSTNSTRNKDQRNLVDTSTLSHVLNVDTVNKTCLVEPNVPMDRLVEATLKHGLVPPVVMEFPGITVGGGYSGTSGESSSFKHGFFDRTVRKVEMVLADGEVVNLTPGGEKGDLFDGAAGAVGTFGVTTLVELKLQDAKKFVETTYHPVKSMKEAIKVLNTATSGKLEGGEVDYVDGIMFSPTQGAIITGRLTDAITPSTPTQTFSHAWDPWFYLHVQERITSSAGKTTTEAIPLAEYFFRYDRGGFWVGCSAFDYFKFPFNRLTRWWLDDFVHTRMMYSALHASGEAKKYIVQDLALPYSTAEKFVEYTAKEFGIWPLWLCPLKQSTGMKRTMHPHSLLRTESGEVEREELMLNIGLWGFGPGEHGEFVRKNKELEKVLTELGGMKWLYAHTYYGEEEFWGMFDRKWYEGLRGKYRAKGLPSVWEKVRVDVVGERRAVEGVTGWRRVLRMWPFGGFYGIWMAIKSRSYVAARASVWKEFGKK